MVDNFKIFSSSTQYNAYITGSTVVLPNVSLIGEDDVRYKPAPPHDYSKDYLTLVILDNGGSIWFNYDVYWSLDSGNTWESASDYLNVNSGDRVSLKANIKHFTSSSPLFSFGVDVRFNVEGNIMSIYDSTGFRTRTTFDGQNDGLSESFANKDTLISAENLVLPVTTLTDYCYSFMFYSCTSMTTAPKLPATTLSNGCYKSMFGGCSSLNYVECLATDISASDCTLNWLSSVSSTGTFVKAPSMTSWTTGYRGIPSGWTVQDA